MSRFFSNLLSKDGIPLFPVRISASSQVYVETKPPDYLVFSGNPAVSMLRPVGRSVVFRPRLAAGLALADISELCLPLNLY